MTSKEWVKNELSLSYDHLTTNDRIMLNRILKDLERKEELEKENRELVETLELYPDKKEVKENGNMDTQSR